MAEYRPDSGDFPTPQVVEFENYRFNVGTGELWRGDTEIKLAPRAAALLGALTERPMQVVTKQDLVDRVWNGKAVGDDALTSCVQELRRVLGDDPRRPRLIETRYGRGYRMLVPVTSAARESARTSSPLQPGRPSIAVLPFENISNDEGQQYFVDGLVEDIITGLSRFKSLFVISRQSSFSYKSPPLDVRRVAQKLGVHYILQGSARKASNRIRIAAQLIEAETGANLWADKFDGALEDVFDLQDLVTSNVVGIIAPRVEKLEIERSRSNPSTSPRAYDLLLRAQSLMRTTRRDDLVQANSLLRQAVEIDPTYARAMANLARCCWLFVIHGYGHRDDHLVADVTGIAQEALSLDATDSEVVGVAAYILGLLGGDMETGIALVEKSIALNPNNAEAYRAAGVLYGYLGQVDQAIENQRRSDRLNPLDAGFSRGSAYTLAYFGVGDHQQVLDWTAQMLRERPDFTPALRYRAASLALVGHMDEARRVVARILEQTPNYTVSDVRRHQEFDLNSPFRKPGVADALYRGLRLAGLPE